MTVNQWFLARLKSVAWAALFVVGCGGHAFADESTAWTKTPPKIEGSDRFVAQVEEALKRIRERAPRAYKLIQQNVAIIKQSERSGMWAFRNPPTFEMGDRTTFYSVTWCAGSIAHDALHSKLYHDYRAAKGKPVPNEIWTGRNAELKCISFQIDVLKKIRASDLELQHCMKQNGEHFDIDKDGKYEWSDYFKRDW